jgi:dipeptidyl aminopeptidase/acylaminoacyl peptidase
LQQGWQVSTNGGLAFSLDGGNLYFGVAPIAGPKPRGPTTTEERAQVELWHGQDDFIQPMQKVRAQSERDRSYRAVVHLADGACRQLADTSLPGLIPAPKGDGALGSDDRPYRRLVGREQAAADYYLVNTRTGTRKLLIKKQTGPVIWSPEGRFALFFNGKDWFTVAFPSGKITNLTAKLGPSFVREDYDMPSQPPPYASGGWTVNDRQVLLYDRFDIWLAAPDGSRVRNLTAGKGRESRTRYRVLRLNPREHAFDPGKPLLLQMESEATGDTGFARAVFTGGVPVPLVSGPAYYGLPLKARETDTVVLTRSSFHDFPDLYATDQSFSKMQRISDANPRKAGLLWGRAELVNYRNGKGLALQGVLIKPDNFDSKKKYPMMVHIYERLSNRLHRFVDPQPGTSINLAHFASNGYLVLLPDIAYTVGEPGPSAERCVLAAIEEVVKRGFVDVKAIGIQGHSWGGYQVAYLVTKTNKFKAAAAGAPVANMTSAYGGIRYGTGFPRQFQYEKLQSRIGGTLWEFPDRYLSNSPVFRADRVKTPMMILHNDKDEAVPWTQGIELYLALRRLDKEVYFFNYPGEAHGLRKRANRKDYTRRLQEFFDHHLKGAPKPAWMAKGIPYALPTAPAK